MSEVVRPYFWTDCSTAALTVANCGTATGGIAIAARLSYLVNGLIDQMAIEPFGADATDCFEGYHEVDRGASQLRLLLNYALAATKVVLSISTTRSAPQAGSAQDRGGE